MVTYARHRFQSIYKGWAIGQEQVQDIFFPGGEINQLLDTKVLERIHEGLIDWLGVLVARNLVFFPLYIREIEVSADPGCGCWTFVQKGSDAR